MYGDVLASSCICAGEEQARREGGGGGREGKQNERTSHGLCAARWLGVKWQILVGKLALPSLRELRDESCLNVPFLRPPPPTAKNLSFLRHPRRGNRPSPTQFRLAQAPVPSTRWLKPQTDPLCVRVASEQDTEDERGKNRERERERESRCQEYRLNWMQGGCDDNRYTFLRGVRRGGVLLRCIFVVRG